MADPWMKFYTSDWRSDPRLRLCGLPARGLWIEMIALMHEATPYGHLLVSGLSPTDAQLAMLVGAPPDQIPDLVGELESAGVFSRTRSGAIYSRKMTRMAKKAATSRKNGSTGGNPKLSKERANQPWDNQEVNPGLKTQKPEARSQREEEDISVPSEPHSNAPPAPRSSGAPQNGQIPPKASGPPFDAFWVRWPAKKGRLAAEKAWKRLGVEDRERVVSSTSAWFSAWRRSNPDARDILPATFLNGRRWEDDFGGSTAGHSKIARFERMGR